MYSLILSDEVVSEIDRVAKMTGQSRSGLINQILAEYVSYVTPEARMNSLFSELERIMSGYDNFKLMFRPGDGAFTAMSVLKYKYNPSIRYSVTLYPDAENYIGELRAVLRTQNPELLRDFSDFCRIWDMIEKAVTEKPTKTEHSGGVYRRCLSEPKSENDRLNLGQSISSYIGIMNKSLGMFIAERSDLEKACSDLTEYYKNMYYTDKIKV